jgi:hypothetical protein
MSGSSTTLTPVSQIGQTILGITRQLEASLGITPTYDIQSTLNAKYGVAPSALPTALPTILYFGIGIGGCYNVSNLNLSQPYPVLQTNMDLYSPIPFRCVPVEQDLSAQERALYRMRVRKTILGADYFCYYLKMITFDQTAVSVTETNPTTGIMTPYVPNYANLNPTPPVVSTSGTTADTEVNVSLTSTLPLTGAEVTEAINVLYAGDLRYARISELGLYSGQDNTAFTGLDVNGSPINYTEAVLAQLNTQYTWNGDDFSNPTKTSNYQIANGSGDLLLV